MSTVPQSLPLLGIPPQFIQIHTGMRLRLLRTFSPTGLGRTDRYIWRGLACGTEFVITDEESYGRIMLVITEHPPILDSVAFTFIAACDLTADNFEVVSNPAHPTKGAS